MDALTKVGWLLAAVDSLTVPAPAALGWLLAAVGGLAAPAPAAVGWLLASVDGLTVPALAALGWLLAAVGGAAALALHARLRAYLSRVARAAHELRGPLSAARLALAGVAGEAARLAAVDLELCRAGLVVGDLADGREPARAARVDLTALAREALPGWRAVGAAHGATIMLVASPSGPAVRGDRLRLAQACANLVANAAEHGGGDVRVVIGQSAAHARLEVRDAGPGLPAPVAQLVRDARGRRSPRGHGLAVAAAIAEAHGGRLSAAPAARGARLVLELPLADPGGYPPTPRAREAKRRDRAAPGAEPRRARAPASVRRTHA